MINNYDEISIANVDSIIDEIRAQIDKVELSTDEFININNMLSSVLLNYMSSFMPENVKSIIINNQESAFHLSQLKYEVLLESQKRIIMMWSRCREVLERIKTYQYTLCEKRQEIIEEQSALNNLFNDMFELVSHTKQILHKYSSYIIEQSSTEAIDAYSSIGIDLFEENAEAHHWLDARTRLIHNLNTIKEMYDSLIKSISH